MKTLSLGKVQSRRGTCLDFIVSGKSLLLEFERRGYDLLPGLVGGDREATDVAMRAQLFCEEPGGAPSGRVGLYFCPLCGDYGCGTITARIERDGNAVIWSDFVYENGYDEEVIALERLGPFRFDWQHYRDVLLARPVT